MNARGGPRGDPRGMPAADRRPYPLGYSQGELDRPERQGTFLRELTRDFLHRAGLVPGMSVLDAGRGVRDVSLLAAGLVGRAGAVVGVDRSAEPLAAIMPPPLVGAWACTPDRGTT